MDWRPTVRCLMSFVSLVALIAVPATAWTDWSVVPLAEWTKAESMDTTIGLHPTSGVWSEREGRVIIEGKADYWDTRLAPGDQGRDTRVAVSFTIEQSSRMARRLPGMQTARWAYHYGENAPGWDFGVVSRRSDPLRFYRICLSGHRGELALWDSLGEFLQLVPCPVEVGEPHQLEVVCHGPRFEATLDGTDDGATIPLKPRLQALDCKVPMGQIKTLFPLEAFTYEFWARPQIPVGGPGARGPLLNFRWNVNLDFSQFNEADKTCRLYYQNDRRNPNDRWHATGHVRIERRVPYGQWLHIMTTHANGQVVLYVDGEPAGRANYDTRTPGFEFFMFEPAYHIGWTYGGGGHYRGDVGPIRLYARALSAEEVAERYRTGWPRKK